MFFDLATLQKFGPSDDQHVPTEGLPWGLGPVDCNDPHTSDFQSTPHHLFAPCLNWLDFPVFSRTTRPIHALSHSSCVALGHSQGPSHSLSIIFSYITSCTLNGSSYTSCVVSVPHYYHTTSCTLNVSYSSCVALGLIPGTRSLALSLSWYNTSCTHTQCHLLYKQF